MMHYLAPLHEVLSDTEAVAELDSLSSHLTSFLTSSILMLLFEICAPKVRKLQWEQSSASIECALAFLTKTSETPTSERSKSTVESRRCEDASLRNLDGRLLHQGK